MAKRFDREALCHIPDYEDVIDLSISAIEESLGSDAYVSRVCDIGYETHPENLLTFSFNSSASRKINCLRATTQRTNTKNFHFTPLRCATANTMLALTRRGFMDVHGVEASRPMLRVAKAKLVAFGLDSAAVDARLHMASAGARGLARVNLCSFKTYVEDAPERSIPCVHA